VKHCDISPTGSATLTRKVSGALSRAFLGTGFFGWALPQMILPMGKMTGLAGQIIFADSQMVWRTGKVISPTPEVILPTGKNDFADWKNHFSSA